jgi:hypothetical protein
MSAASRGGREAEGGGLLAESCLSEIFGLPSKSTISTTSRIEHVGLRWLWKACLARLRDNCGDSSNCTMSGRYITRTRQSPPTGLVDSIVCHRSRTLFDQIEQRPKRLLDQ